MNALAGAILAWCFPAGWVLKPMVRLRTRTPPHVVQAYAWLALGCCLLVLLCGCQGAASGSRGFSPAPAPAAGRGLVYLYRPESIAVGTAPAVAINGTPALQLPVGTYTWLHLPVGSHTFKVDWPRENGGLSDLDFTLDVVEGSVIAVKVSAVLERSDMLHERYVLEAFRVPEVKAYREMVGCCTFAPSYRYGLDAPL